MAKGEVDLIIKAKNDASKALDAISASLKNLTDQQIIAGNAATQADGKLNALSLELAKLRANAQNLQQLANIAGVLNTATSALDRQRQAVTNTTTAHQKLTDQQDKLRTRQTDLATGIRTATTEVKQQQTALQSAKDALATLSKEATALGSAQRNTQRSLDAVTKLIQTQQAAVEKAAQKHAQLAAAVAATETPTKRLTTSLDAAAASLAKKTASLEASRAKEQALTDALQQNATAQTANQARVQAASDALKQQQVVLEQAKAKLAALTTESKTLGQSQNKLDQDVAKSQATLTALKAALDTAEAEYRQLVAAANQAKAAVGQTSASMTGAGQAAVQAAAQLATFAARARVLQSSRGTTSAPLSINVADISAAIGAMRNAQAVITATQRSYSAAAVSAADLQKAITAIGTASSSLSPLLEAVQRQRAAVDGAYTSWKSAEAEVKRLAEAVRAAGVPTEALATAFGVAQGQAKIAKTEFLNQQNQAKQLAASLQQAGAGAGTLSSAEAALTASLRNTTSMSSQATEALNRLRQSEENAGPPGSRLSQILQSLRSQGSSVAGALGQAAGGLAKIREGASSAAGPLGSLGGELKSLAVQVAGIYALKQGFDSLLDTSTNFDALGAKIRVAFGGDLQAANQALDYSLSVAKNLKLPLIETAKGYADLAVAARGTALEGKGVNEIFTAFAQAARVTRTSSSDLSGIFRALTQSISKGKVQAEELRGQLGDRLPGAIQIMATALGVSTKQLDKMMVNGELTIETLQRMAAEVSKRVAPELQAALDSPAAKIQAFKNQWTELQLQLAKSGFLDAVGTAAEKLGDALSRPEVIQSVTQLGTGLADVVTYLSNVEDPLGKVQTVLEVLVGMQLASWIAGIVGGIGSMVTGLYLIATAAAAAEIALAPILITVGALAALFALPWLASWAYDNFPAFREGVLSIGTVTQEVGSTIQLAFELAFAYVKRAVIGFVNDIKTSWSGMMNDMATTVAKVGNFFGSDALNDWAASVAKDNQDAAADSEKAWKEAGAGIDAAWARYAQRQKAREAEIAAERAKYAKKSQGDAAKTTDDLINQLAGGKPTGTGAGLGRVTPPSGTFKPDTSDADAKAAAKAAKKRAQMEQSVADQISAIRARLDQNRANDLDTQLKGVEEKYKGLYDDLRKLGLSETSEQWKQVDALKAQEMQLVRNKAAKAADEQKAKDQREAEKQINDMLSLRRELLDQIKYAEGKGDYVTADKLKVQYDALNVSIRQAIDAQIKYWEAAGGPNADLAIAKLKAQADGLDNVKEKGIATADTFGKAFGQELSGAVDSFVDKIKETGDVFGSLKDAFKEFAASFLADMAKMILKQLLFNAISGIAGGGGFFGAAASAITGSAHTGGIAGSPTLNKRSVDPGIFAGAARYHTGGVVGLQPWEVPIIAKKNEEVLTEDDPRHINNVGSSTESGNGNPGMSNLQIINAIDSESVVQAGLSSPAGVKTVINLVKANKQTFKSILA